MNEHDSKPELGTTSKAGELAKRGRSGSPDPDIGDLTDEIASLRRENVELRRRLELSVASGRALEHELQHRVHNMLAVIRSIYRRSRESSEDPKEFADHFAGRLDAIARYQNQVDGSDRSDVEVEDIVRDELHEVRCSSGPDCSIGGPPVTLRQKSAELFGLAIHELTTNSIKFGALSKGGRLDIKWSVQRGALHPSLRFRWTETGVPMLVFAPRHSGFGRQLIEEALPYQLSAAATFTLKPGGIECEILLPLTDEADDEPQALAGNHGSSRHPPERSEP